MVAHDKSTPPVISLVAGGVAGGVEGAISYPFEFAKTRVQLQRERGYRPPRNPYSVVINIYRTEGLRAIYKGCGALVIGSVAKDAVRFLSFDTVKNAFKDPETGTLTPARNMFAGMTAGVLASIAAVTPSERLKTALIDDARHDRRYTSSLHAIRTIIRDDGFMGMYRGFVGTTLKQASATSFRMGSYNIIKDIEVKRNISQNTVMNFLNGAVAGVITTLLSQPFDTIKTRSQSAKATTTVEAVKGIWSDGGLRAFWRGTVMRLSRTIFSGGILFTTFEAVSKVITPIYEKRLQVV